MTAWQLIRTHLAADSSVTSVATGGIYPVRGKQGEARPQVIGQQNGSSDTEDITGALTMVDATLDIGCVAVTYDAAVSLYESVRASIRAMRQQTISGKRVHAISITNAREESYPPDEAAVAYAVVFTLNIKHES